MPDHKIQLSKTWIVVREEGYPLAVIVIGDQVHRVVSEFIDAGGGDV
jgi:hypothetical protein